MKIMRSEIDDLIREEMSEAYREREVGPEFANPDAVKGLRHKWYERGVLAGKKAVESGMNTMGQYYSDSYGGWNPKHGELPEEYMQGYDEGSGGLAKEHYEAALAGDYNPMDPPMDGVESFTEGKLNIAKSRVKQIIQEELDRPQASEAFGIQGHEPEAELVTVTEEELTEARHAAYYLVKQSLESGADSASLEGTVRDVYGYNVPSYILELFSVREELDKPQAPEPGAANSTGETQKRIRKDHNALIGAWRKLAKDIATKSPESFKKWQGAFDHVSETLAGIRKRDSYIWGNNPTMIDREEFQDALETTDMVYANVVETYHAIKNIMNSILKDPPPGGENRVEVWAGAFESILKQVNLLEEPVVIPKRQNFSEPPRP